VGVAGGDVGYGEVAHYTVGGALQWGVCVSRGEGWGLGLSGFRRDVGRGLGAG